MKKKISSVTLALFRSSVGDAIDSAEAAFLVQPLLKYLGSKQAHPANALCAKLPLTTKFERHLEMLISLNAYRFLAIAPVNCKAN